MMGEKRIFKTRDGEMLIELHIHMLFGHLMQAIFMWYEKAFREYSWVNAVKYGIYMHQDNVDYYHLLHFLFHFVLAYTI